MYVLCCCFLSDEAMEVKSSSSISALDAISEAPEEDVDMMSQEDEDFAVYGSRSSLIINDEKRPTSGCSEGEPEVSDDDEDMVGSRNSLSGLKRWTTEENLSMNDPRSGSQTELMDTPLHDSHSNSTGKRIFTL